MPFNAENTVIRSEEDFLTLLFLRFLFSWSRGTGFTLQLTKQSSIEEMCYRSTVLANYMSRHILCAEAHVAFVKDFVHGKNTNNCSASSGGGGERGTLWAVIKTLENYYNRALQLAMYILHTETRHHNKPPVGSGLLTAFPKASLLRLLPSENLLQPSEFVEVREARHATEHN